MFQGFAHSELLSMLRIRRGFSANVLTAGNTLWTASASPQPAAGIDSWEQGYTMYRNLVVVVDVASITAGTLTISLYDSPNAITTANVAASTQKVCDFGAISAAGKYVMELQIGEWNFGTSARVTADANNVVVRRHHTLKAVAAVGDSTFSAMMIYGMNKRNWPYRGDTRLSVTRDDAVVVAPSSLTVNPPGQTG